MATHRRGKNTEPANGPEPAPLNVQWPLYRLLDKLPTAAYLCDASGQIVYFNAAAERLWGRAPKLNSPEDRYCGSLGIFSTDGSPIPHDQCWMAVALQSGGEYNERELLIERPDGHRVTVLAHVSAIHTDAGELLGALNVLIDLTERRKMEESLRDSERFLQLSQSAGQCGSWEWDVVTNRVRWSDEMHRLNGLSPGEFEGTLEASLRNIHPDDRPRVDERLNQIFTDRRAIPIEYRIVTPAGESRWVWARGEILFDHGGAPRRVLGTIFDITQRKQADEQLRDSEALLRGLVETSPIAMLIVTADPSHQILSMNRRFTEVFGYTLNEVWSVESWRPRAYPDPNYREQMRSVWRHTTAAAQRDGRSAVGPVEALVTCLDGMVRHVEIYMGAYGGRALVLFNDLTERKQAEEKLLEKQLHLVASQSIARVGSWELDLDRQDNLDPNPLRWSDECYRVFGYQPGEVEVSNEVFWSLVHPDDRPKIEAAVRRALDTKSVYEIDHRIVLPDGRERIVHERAELRLDAAGKPLKFIGTAQDVTEQRRAEEERQNLEAQMRHAEKMKSLGVLAGGIAHDFNNLLTAIQGYADLMAMQLPASSPVRPLVGNVRKAIRRAADLTEQMLAYSGRGKFVIQPLRLDRLVHDMSNLLRMAISKKAELRLDLAPATVEGDVAQIRQIVMNLITNASDAMNGDSGVISIRVGVRHMTPEALTSPYLNQMLAEGSYAYLEVRDTGCGMSAATLEKIFEPFFSTKFTGRGLGLAAALGIVRGHRGTLQVVSAPGQGATFVVLFPAMSGDPGVVVEEETTTKLSQGRGTILLIDDDAIVREVLKGVLEQAGFQVLLAVDGQDGVNIFDQRHEEIHAVVLDLTMPRMDGREAFALLRRRRPTVPILIMSGYNEPEALAHDSGSGPYGFLQKPFTATDLIVKVCQMVSPDSDPGP